MKICHTFLVHNSKLMVVNLLLYNDVKAGCIIIYLFGSKNYISSTNLNRIQFINRQQRAMTVKGLKHFQCMFSFFLLLLFRCISRGRMSLLNIFTNNVIIQPAANITIAISKIVKRIKCAYIHRIFILLFMFILCVMFVFFKMQFILNQIKWSFSHTLQSEKRIAKKKKWNRII